jgi:hypothetical protein
MQIDVERFAFKDVPVDPDTFSAFAAGPAGFSDCRHFRFFHQEGPQPAVFRLQSLDDVVAAFPIVAPETLNGEYEKEPSDADCARLQLERAADAPVGERRLPRCGGGRRHCRQRTLADHSQSAVTPGDAEDPAGGSSDPALSRGRH